VIKNILLSLWLLTTLLSAEHITIFAASDLKYALDHIKKIFLQENPGNEITVVYGSSGKGMLQVENGAPYALYFSANMDYIEVLQKKGAIVSPPKHYATGRLVIWSKNSHFDPSKGFDNLKANWVKKIAIANPSHAPYGQKAKQAMESMGLYHKLKSKIVFGENISSTAAYISTKAADIGIIALSLALAPPIADTPFNRYYLIDDSLHKPLEQGYGITKQGKNSKLAHAFYNYMQTKKALDAMKEYGFIH